MATEEYLTFNQTLEKLGITEDELLNLVSGNQLRAFRIDRETKFRVQDVEQLCKEGGTVLAAQESAVLDFDDLEDVKLMEDKPAAADEIALVEEPAPAEPAVDFGDDSLEIVEPTTDSNPELEETVMTDSSQVAHTEELSLDDDNYDFSTQEVTIHEDALSEDEVGASQTSVDETIPVEEEPAPAASHRMSARASAAYSGASRRTLAPAGSGEKTIGDLVWTGLLAVCALGMIYPAMLMGTMLFYGMTTTREFIAPSDVTYDSKHEANIGSVWVPKMFRWVQEKDLKNTFGSATYAGGLTEVLPFEERVKRNMIKLEQPAAAEPKKEEAPAPAPAN